MAMTHTKWSVSQSSGVTSEECNCNIRGDHYPASISSAAPKVLAIVGRFLATLDAERGSKEHLRAYAHYDTFTDVWTDAIAVYTEAITAGDCHPASIASAPLDPQEAKKARHK